MQGLGDHGPRLSGAEYDEKVAELYLALPAHPSPEEEQYVRRREFDLLIDHRLGIQFPEKRREALWRVNERMSRHPLRMLLAWKLGRVLPQFLAAAVGRLSARVIEEYRSVLTPQELELFFGKNEIASPGLPIDRDTPPEDPR